MGQVLDNIRGHGKPTEMQHTWDKQVTDTDTTGTFWSAEEQKAAAQSVDETTTHFYPGSTWNKPPRLSV